MEQRLLGLRLDDDDDVNDDVAENDEKNSKNKNKVSRKKITGDAQDNGEYEKIIAMTTPTTTPARMMTMMTLTTMVSLNVVM